MKLSGLHLLITYQCTYECDHCFVWGSPFQSGVMTLEQIELILRQAQAVGSIDSIYFEGGEPFLYYSTLRKGVELAREASFQVGIVSNAYWATSLDDALECLRPFAGLVEDLSVSSDLFHANEMLSQQARYAEQAARLLGIPTGLISVAPVEHADAPRVTGQLPEGLSGVMFRGRAVEKLAQLTAWRPWQQFDSCPHEDFSDLGRVHIDPFLNVHLCQGVLLGNLTETPLTTLCAQYEPSTHPIVAALLHGGPAELVRRYQLPHAEAYADACHLCYRARQALRAQFPALIAPDQVFGVS